MDTHQPGQVSKAILKAIIRKIMFKREVLKTMITLPRSFKETNKQGLKINPRKTSRDLQASPDASGEVVHRSTIRRTLTRHGIYARDSREKLFLSK